MSSFKSNATYGVEYDKSFTDTVFACAMFYQQNVSRDYDAIRSGEIYQNLMEKLTKIYGIIAKLESNTLGVWDSDSVNPGWLLRIDGALSIRVPAHLAPLFPESDDLSRLAAVGQEVKTTSDSLLYLSGSNATKKIFDVVDDIDFCEYVPCRGDNIKLSVLNKVDAIGEVACVALSCPKDYGKYERPFSELGSISDCLSRLNPEHEKYSTFMVHFLAVQSTRRVFEVSNVIIVCNEEYMSKGFKRTFAHQGVQITPSDIVPNSLNDVMELGRYVIWLLNQVRKYRDDGNFAKMLKRTLALTRVSWMKNYTLDIASFFENSASIYENEVETIRRLRAKISVLNGEESWNEPLFDLDYYEKLANLDLEKSKLKEGKVYPEGAETAAIAIVSRLADEVKQRSKGALMI